MGLLARLKAVWHALLHQSVSELEDKHVIALAETKLHQATDRLKEARQGLVNYQALVLKVQAQVDSARSRIASLTGQIKNHLKAKLRVSRDDVPPLPAGMTGADIESLLVQAIRRAALAGGDPPGREVFREALAHFRAPDYGLEKELQELVAIREATDPAFVPEPLRHRYAAPDKAAVEHRIQEISTLLGSSSR